MKRVHAGLWLLPVCVLRVALIATAAIPRVEVAFGGLLAVIEAYAICVLMSGSWKMDL